MSEYLGALAPFYISRWRLELLGQRVAPGWKGKMKGEVSFPGVGELGFDREGQAPGTLARLERVLSWLARTGAIGDAWDPDCDYTWVHAVSHITWMQNAVEGVDHLVVADPRSVVPAGWSVFLAGLRTNLVSLDPPGKYPELGSSPLALQAVLREISAADKKPGAQAVPVRRDGTSRRLRAACRSLAGEQPRWDVGGVVEIVYRDARQNVLLGSPLFLSLFTELPDGCATGWARPGVGPGPGPGRGWSG